MATASTLRTAILFFISETARTRRQLIQRFVEEANHSEDHNHSHPEQYFAKRPASDPALAGAVLLPKSEGEQCDGQTQQPGTKSGEECARGTSSESGGEAERKATTDRRQRTENRTD